MAEQAIELVAKTEFGIEDPDETGLSFVENAILKARHAASLSHLPALADDSDAFARLVDKYQKRAVGVAYRLLGNSDDAAITQQRGCRVMVICRDAEEMAHGIT